MTARRAPVRTPEGQVLRACLDLLQLRGILAWRSNNAPIPIRNGKRLLGLRPTLTPGLPDILGLLPSGRLLAVECKSEEGRLSDAQAAFLAALERAGALTVVARSAAELDEALQREARERESWDAVRRERDALRAKNAVLVRAVRHANFRNHPPKEGCDGCAAIRVLAERYAASEWPPSRAANEAAGLPKEGT